MEGRGMGKKGMEGRAGKKGLLMVGTGGESP